MASLISQMRNGQLPQQPAQMQLNESIQRTRALMQQFKTMNNSEAAIANLLQQNPQLTQIIPMLKNGNSLEGIARQIAQVRGIDINQLVQQLQEGKYNG